jgi:hypothetical protein
VTANRDFVMAVSLASEQCGSATFRIDTGNQVRQTPSWPRSWANLNFFIALFPQECMGQLAYFGPT